MYIAVYSLDYFPLYVFSYIYNFPFYIYVCVCVCVYTHKYHCAMYMKLFKSTIL